MQTTLATFTLLLAATALATRQHARRTTATVNSPSDPGFDTGSNQTVTAWTRGGCGNNTMGDDNILFSNLLYGKNNHALVVSYILSRDLSTNEQLDMSFAYADGHQVPNPADGTEIDWECSLFQFTASPDKTSGSTLKAGTCYTPSAPVTCFNLWRTS